MKKISLLYLLLFIGMNLKAQEQPLLNIHVYGAYEDDTSALIGANVFWLGTTSGGATNENGIAKIPFHHHLPHQLVITYVGLQNDTMLINDTNKKHYYRFLKDDALLAAIEVKRKRQTSYISSVDPVRSDFIGSGELKKAACCNLSESFETNAAVDVSYSDAVTGAKEIKLLGLDGTYVEMLQENVPALRGLAIPFGLSYAPGPWMQSISISKGAGSILSGHESFTGSINYAYKRPFETKPLELDLFANHLRRYEANLVSGFELSEKVAGVFLANVGGQHSRKDNNEDGFIDQTLYNRVNAMNRWQFKGENVRGQLAFNYLLDDRMGGQTDFNIADRNTENTYGFGSKTHHIEAYGKTAIFMRNNENQNVGLTYSTNYHKQNSFFGLNDYNAEQLSFNVNALFNTIIKTTNHKLTTGVNAYFDDYAESFQDIIIDEQLWNVGLIAEYSYKYAEKLNLIAGARLDYHSKYKTQFSPRFHLKYTPKTNTTFRLSAGRGFRNARILGENISLMASSRKFVVEEPLDLESAWNTGISFVQKFQFKQRDAYIAVDFYHTNFQNQVIKDVNAQNNEVNFYNLKGKSYANSFLTEFSIDVTSEINFKIAYKIDDVKITLKDGLQAMPFNYLHKGLFVGTYTSKNKAWQVDVNFDMHGKHRLPNSFAEDVGERFSPFYVQLGTQVSYFAKNGIEIYVGGENITNYRQPNPIIGAETPFGNSFDTAQIWGPVVGGILYGGLRYSLAKKKDRKSEI